MTSENSGADLHGLVDELRTQRDQLRVRLHLAKAEVKDEWARLEHKWAHVQANMDAIEREAGKAAEGVATALRLAAEELRTGYRRIRQRL
jgi:ClpP class serine protease